MKTFQLIPFCLFVTTVLPCTVVAQQPPAIGYMFPPGAQAGQSTEVILGGYDWTPDMELFVHDPRIKLEIIGEPGPVIVPEPPYWFSKKARRPPFLLPRETRARLTIPAGVPAGIVKWQAANANGATAAGRLVVGDIPQRTESEPQLPLQLDSLPICVSGQIKHIKEVDQYTFTATKTGPITCSTTAKKIDSQLHAVLEIRDSSGRLVSEAADTAGHDTSLTFAATENETYVASIYDLDFRGNRSFVYQLTITAGPRVVAAIPSVGLRGETRTVEFVGYGIATGQAKLEVVNREVTFAAESDANAFPYRLQTEHGDCLPFSLAVSDEPQLPESAVTLSIPCGVTGVFDERFDEDRYEIVGTKGDVWSINVSSERIGSRVDAVLAVHNSDGKEVGRNDDLPNSTDAALEFKVPADGTYQMRVTDASSRGGDRAATYHLSVRNADPGFQLSIPEFLNAPIDGKTKLAIKVTRSGGFQDPVDISFADLPTGVTAPENLQVAAKQKALNVELTVAADAPASAALVQVTGRTTIGEETLEQTTAPILIATTLKPPFTIDAEGQDDVTKWPRGTTFPAPALIVRDDGFAGDIMLEMTSKQGRHRQGITGPDLLVRPGTTRILYPVYLPEWLETTRTSRMVVNGVAKVADPQGNIRYSVARQKTRMGFLPTGALLKISADEDEFQVRPGQEIRVPISIDRSSQLREPIALQLVGTDTQPAFIAEPQDINATTSQVEFPITVSATCSVGDEYALKLRATLLKDGEWPVISETMIVVQIVE